LTAQKNTCDGQRLLAVAGASCGLIAQKRILAMSIAGQRLPSNNISNTLRWLALASAG